ncbi:MAG: hypothetical protein HKL80_11085 [Acidimicrobiales bacterium]|nr:hypothetical protein [Acidimicrobiales bacterium]
MSTLQKVDSPRTHQRKRPGEKLCILVAGPGECIAIDMASGVLIRSVLPDSIQAMCGSYELVEANKRPALEPKDPSRPEAVRLEGNVNLTGKRVRRRRAHRIIRPLLAPKSLPVLGFRGPAASYWTLSGNHPSVTIVAPDRGPLMLSRKDGSVWIRFGMGRNVEELPVVDPRISSTVKANGATRMGGKHLYQVLGWKPKLIVIALSMPLDGYCYKTVVGLLP